MTTPNDTGAIAAEEQDWSDGYSEQPFNKDGQGNQWADWGQVQQLSINPPLGSLEEVIRRTPVTDGMTEAEVALLQQLMTEQITAPCSRWGLELRFLRSELRLLTEVLGDAGDAEDDELLNLDPDDYKEFGNAFYSIPLTPADCRERVGAIRERVREIEDLITWAKRDGVYYDVCGLLDWFATPPEKRTTDSPAHVLPFFGQVLFGVLGLSGQNTTWSHIEAVGSRQIATKFGGDQRENEKTRYRGQGGSGSNEFGVASNAPR